MGIIYIYMERGREREKIRLKKKHNSVDEEEKDNLPGRRWSQQQQPTPSSNAKP